MQRLAHVLAGVLLRQEVSAGTNRARSTSIASVSGLTSTRMQVVARPGGTGRRPG